MADEKLVSKSEMTEFGEIKITLVSNLTLTFVQADRVKTHRNQFFAALFTIGLFNNNGYSMIGAGAASLAEDFNRENLMPMF